jgi:hypothetical protein
MIKEIEMAKGKAKMQNFKAIPIQFLDNYNV